MARRYTAIVKVVRVDDVSAAGTRGNVPGAEHTKDTEVANLVIRNSTLANLIKAIKGHLDLVEETE